MDNAVIQCRSWDEAEVILTSLTEQNAQLAQRVRTLEKQIDTHGSRWWKRLWFRVNGWPAWWIIDKKPVWRPWHRWTGW